MRNYSAVGLIFANMHDEALRDATAIRSMGSLPFGGRYRLIDFPLSAMVNAGITKVGVITKSNYRSLMDHIGSGKAWDLSRKNEGLYFLPPPQQRRRSVPGPFGLPGGCGALPEPFYGRVCGDLGLPYGHQYGF